MDEIKGIRIVSLTGKKEYGIEDSEVREELANVVDGAPEELDSFKEAFEKFKEGGEVLAGIATEVAAVGKAVTDEAARAQGAEQVLDEKITEEVRRATIAEHGIETKALDASSAEYEATEDTVVLKFATIEGTGNEITIPAATAEKAGVMSAEDKVSLDSIPNEIEKIKDGDTIVGQAREIHSRNGKTVTDSFLARTTAGSGTIGDGVASVKQIGGNIVKNLIDGVLLSELSANYGTVTVENGIVVFSSSSTSGKGSLRNYKTSTKTEVFDHKYYQACLLKCSENPNKNVFVGWGSLANTFPTGFAATAQSHTDWQWISVLYSSYTTSDYHSVVIGDKRKSDWGKIYVKNYLHIDLTEMFGNGKEPTKEECDRMFGAMDALPQGLSIANPNVFTSTGFNQFNPDNVLEGNAITNNAIESGDKKIAVIPCLPCKVGTGENNGYCIHGEFGEDINVYLTPLNPMEVDGELYMHKLTKDAITGTYVPLIKGYMLVEVPTTANLCAHFLWSEDKCKRDTYEPYFESKIAFPTIPQMSEWGLAGIQSNGTLACDEIDFERGVYVKRIGSFDGGSIGWRYDETYGGFWATTWNLANIPRAKSPYLLNNYPYTGDYRTVLDKTVGYIFDTRPFIKDSSYGTDTTAFKAAMQGVMLYYELAEPEEYPLPKVDNNYISSDYGVEQFDSAVPCNANNLYYMRSLAGETRNFLDRMYDNTAKTDAKEVADYITNGIEGNKELATNAPNLALRALFVAAGAGYNDSGADKTKTAPWGETVIHKAGHYYLNGLGDITEAQMMTIYNAPHDGRTAFSYARNTGRTFILRGGTQQTSITSLVAWFAQAYQMEALGLSDFIGVAGGSCERMFSGCFMLKHLHLDNFMFSYATGFKDAFTGCSSLITCNIKKVAKNIAFTDSSKISKESIIYIIENAVPSSAITITLHPDAYERLIDDADVVAALEEKNAALAAEGKGGSISLVSA